MNRAKLKEYARQARREFIQAVTDRAAYYGLAPKKTEPIIEKGDVALIGGRAFPRDVAQKRKTLEERILRHGFEQVMETMAYTWFNRLMAIRFMELHGYLDHGYRVLSHPEGKSIPEILEHAEHVELAGLDRSKVIELKLEGTKEEELYRMLLIAQCNALHSAIPFLFERVDDPTELLLPDNLLNTDSVIRHMVSEIPEEDWEEVEIIGWMYQFYISEKKDALMKAKKAYKTEDIPAVTQLFTPNWIVKYLVQNSLGAKWLATYPNSPMRHQMVYYIEPAEQTPEVHAQLKAITPETLNPEELTLLDLACGSGHIMVESYDLLKAIYQERGYRAKDIPRLILEKNLYGLEIDDRAAQLAGFALMMKARGDDRDIFKKGVKPNVVVIKEMTAPAIKEKAPEGADDLVELFKDAKTCGSLIRVPEELAKKLSGIKKAVEERKAADDLWTAKYYEELAGILPQAELLSKHYDCVIANPPYMGGKWMNAKLKEFAKNEYKGYEKDLFSAFIIRGRELAHENGNLGFMSPFVWMFISSHEELRLNLIDRATLTSLIQLEYSGFAEATVPICTFTFNNKHIQSYIGSFIRLSDFRGAENQAPKTLEAINNKRCGWFYSAKPDDFKKIPGSPIAYWVSERFVNPFIETKELIHDLTISDGQTKTGDNDRFLRQHWEVASHKVGVKGKWWQHPKGGSYRKWYGNVDWVIDWSEDARKHYRKDHVARILPEYLWGKKGISWTLITSAEISFRTLEPNQIFNLAAPSLYFHDENNILKCLGFLNTKYVAKMLQVINPTLNMNVGEVRCLPLLSSINSRRTEVETIVEKCLSVSRNDWNSFEISWDFSGLPLLKDKCTKKSSTTVEKDYHEYRVLCQQMTDQMKQLEEENNRIFIEAYSLQDELTPDVPLEEVTLFANPYYRYNGELSEAEREARFKEDTINTTTLSYS